MSRTVCVGWVVALAAASGAGAAPSALCQDEGGVGGVVVHVLVENRTTWCSADTVRANADIPSGTSYPLRPDVSGQREVQVSDGLSINRLLELARVPPQAVTSTYLDRPGGGHSALNAADVSSRPPFDGGLKPAVWVNGSEMSYVRPMRGAGDTNAADFMTAGALDLYVSSGRLLSVAVSASPTVVGVGKLVRLTARVVNPSPSDGPLIYTWDFQDGSTATGSTVTHRFGAAGPYYVVVQVLAGGNGAAGISRPVRVTVGSAPAAASPGSVGPIPRIKPIQIHIGSFGTNPLGAGAASGRGGSGTGSGGSGTGSGGSGSGAGSSASAKPAHPGASPPPRHSPPAPRGTQVDGLLIAGVVPVSASELARQSAGGSAPRASAAAGTSSGGGVTPLGGFLGGAVGLALLAAGSGIEIRSRRRATSVA